MIADRPPFCRRSWDRITSTLERMRFDMVSRVPGSRSSATSPGSWRMRSVSKPRSTRSVSRPMRRPVTPSSSPENRARVSSRPSELLPSSTLIRFSLALGSLDDTLVSSRSSVPLNVTVVSAPLERVDIETLRSGSIADGLVNEMLLALRR